MRTTIALGAVVAAMSAVEAQNCTNGIADWFGPSSSSECQAFATTGASQIADFNTLVQGVVLQFEKCQVPSFVPAAGPLANVVYAGVGPVRSYVQGFVVGQCAPATNGPTVSPTTTTAPTSSPITHAPSKSPTADTSAPTMTPTVSEAPTSSPTPNRPTTSPTLTPTVGPTFATCSLAKCTEIWTNLTNVMQAGCSAGMEAAVLVSNCAGKGCYNEVVAQCKGTAPATGVQAQSADFAQGYLLVNTMCNTYNASVNCDNMFPQATDAPTPGSASTLAVTMVSAVGVVATLFSL